jgi:hypothetical protein
MPTGGLGTPAPGATIDLFHDRVTASWPLIRFLMDDPVYRSQYRALVQEFLGTVFDPSRVGAILRNEQARIAPFVFGPQGESFSRNFIGTPAQFDASLNGPNGLVNYVNGRSAAVRAALQAAP